MKVMADLHSYVVAYDSGFAPNPFSGVCTLATCKPDIRKHAKINDWIVGTGSDRAGVRRGGYLVYAMRVTRELTISEYWNEEEFQKKKPYLFGSYRAACGDNIYEPTENGWNQLNSYHSNPDGTFNPKHVQRDTSVKRVLVGDEFAYFGVQGPRIPARLQEAGLVKSRRGRLKISDQKVIGEFEEWFRGLGVSGYRGKPYDLAKLLGEFP